MTVNLKQSKINRSAQLIIVAGLMTLSVVGCKKDQPVPPSAVPTPVKPVSQVAPASQASVQKAVTSANKAIPVQSRISSGQRPAVVTYNFADRKNPFKPAIVELSQVPKAGGKDALLNPNLLPIQRFEVDKFKVTGIIAGLKENRALLIDPDGKAYVAKTGMVIGPNSGKIIRITANAIEVNETYKDDSGRFKTRTVKLALQKKK